MAEHPEGLAELRKALDRINAEYRDLTRDCRNLGRLVRMAELKRAPGVGDAHPTG
jgi:hypothetical protein